MTTNPFLNGASATVYIVIVALIMTFGMENTGPDDSVFAPIVFLSVFTLSAAVMGYIFFFQPLQLFLDGKKKEAADFFVKTLGAFGAITAVILLLFFSGILQ
jgi:hypothetical protein